MSSKRSGKHEFALYIQKMPPIINHELIIEEPDLVQRISTVLRLTEGESCILFDGFVHVRLRLQNVTKRAVKGAVLSCTAQTPLMPNIHWLLPLLEREAFEEALAFLTILGATSIQPVVTQKTHRAVMHDRDYERAHRVMVAAAEQSKQFCLPELKPVRPLTECVIVGVPVFFDPNGLPANDMIAMLKKTAAEVITCLVGPEGDLTAEEKEYINHKQFQNYRLTPTVLRSQHAIAVGMGLLRALL